MRPGRPVRNRFKRRLASEPQDARGRARRAEAVVDVHHRDAGGAAVQHGQQCGDSAERGAVADARGHGDDGHAREAAHHGRQRALHARHDDGDAGVVAAAARAQQAVQPGHADVVQADDVVAEGAAVAAASSATGRSDVPAVRTTTGGRSRRGGRVRRLPARPCGRARSRRPPETRRRARCRVAASRAWRRSRPRGWPGCGRSRRTAPASCPGRTRPRGSRPQRAVVVDAGERGAAPAAQFLHGQPREPLERAGGVARPLPPPRAARAASGVMPGQAPRRVAR
jgi:hypothetical protein